MVPMLCLLAFTFLLWLDIIVSRRPIVWTRRKTIQLVLASIGAAAMPFVIWAALTSVKAQ
jgi:hypothetical protein